MRGQQRIRFGDAESPSESGNGLGNLLMSSATTASLNDCMQSDVQVLPVELEDANEDYCLWNIVNFERLPLVREGDGSLGDFLVVPVCDDHSAALISNVRHDRRRALGMQAEFQSIAAVEIVAEVSLQGGQIDLMHWSRSRQMQSVCGCRSHGNAGPDHADCG